MTGRREFYEITNISEITGGNCKPKTENRAFIIQKQVSVPENIDFKNLKINRRILHEKAKKQENLVSAACRNHAA